MSGLVLVPPWLCYSPSFRGCGSGAVRNSGPPEISMPDAVRHATTARRSLIRLRSRRPHDAFPTSLCPPSQAGFPPLLSTCLFSFALLPAGRRDTSSGGKPYAFFPTSTTTSTATRSRQ